MRLRSLLFVPGDSDRKIAKGLGTKADALILDLEDAVAPAAKDAARARVAAVLDGAGGDARLWVRINALDSGLALRDLAAVVRPGLAGVMLPKINDASELRQVGHYLDALEVAGGVAPGATRLIVVATETAAAMFNLGSYAPAHPRLAGLTWGAEDLSSAIGAETHHDADGWLFTYRLARAMCLLAAAAAGVAAIDTLYADFADAAGLARSSRDARRDGFVGRLAIHPNQVDFINTAFTPDAAALSHAQAVIAAFAAQPDAGVIAIDGRMYDIPHLKQARRVVG